MKARRLTSFTCVLLAACVSRADARATPIPDAFARFADLVAPGRAYSMRVALHEEIDDRSEDSAYAFARDATGRTSIEILEGRGTGATVLAGSDGVVVSETNVPLFRRHLATDDARVRSLRGRTIADVDLANFVACVREHAAALEQTEGPAIDDRATVALVFKRAGIACPGDPPADRSLAYDVIDVAPASGIPLMRKRYAGREVVERERYRDFR